jgi:glycosyltransferase involved in cell wall biosynthesis
MLSVIIPTHNPKRTYLTRTLEALAAQTLDRSSWELVVVDNKSEDIGYRISDIVGGLESGLPNVRVVREEKLGLTNARLRGFAETTGEIVVLVDDDNVLAPNYLEVVVRIGKEHPQLGTWSGAIELVLEPGSPEPAERLRHLLCERRAERAVWSNDRSHFAATPWGAGECIRRKVAEAYAAKVSREPRRRQLDLQGKDLVYGGDTDIAYTGCELEYAMGVFPELKLKHLTPPTRCTEEYLLKTFEARAYSEVLHGWIETGKIPKQRMDLRGRLGGLARWVFGSNLERKMIEARARGLAKGEEFVSSQSKVNQA